MEATLLDERVLSASDHQRLSRLIDGRLRGAGTLAALLDEADVLPVRERAADIVAMHSHVLLADRHSGQRRSLTLCYPQEAAPADGRVSVLSPVGMSLLGRRAGSVATWRMPDGSEGAAELLEVGATPETS